jgi:NAD(P)-dependent dehydrogenase (short-subunit alcohol dehydrogenase family)
MICAASHARIALVTGASRGLGAAVAESLAAAGTHVMLVARNGALLAGVAARIAAAGGQATIHAADLTRAADVEKLSATVARTWGRLDVLIANAGILGPLHELAHVSEDAWLETLETNLTANWRLLRAFDQLLRRSEAGRVVMLTSSAATNPKPGRGPYAISKAALEMLAKTYALETAGTPMRVNLVDPGRFDSDMRAAAMPNEDRSKLPQPQEIAPMIVALSAPSWLDTGQSLRFAEWQGDKESGNPRLATAAEEIHA